jgi:hypothetical protein
VEISKHAKHRRRRLALLGATPRADWHVVLAVGAIAIAAAVYLGEVRLAAVRAAAAAGELRRGGEDTLTVSVAEELVATFAERGPSPIAPAAPAAATGTPVAATTSAATTTGR